MLYLETMCLISLAIGFRCTLYMMRVEEEGIYVPKAIKRFSLLQDLEETLNAIPERSLLSVWRGCVDKAKEYYEEYLRSCCT
ncbi:hypothetical protein BD560DRAFT_381289 [Blakeslea trispora]|nr:hypothetical protein BD560DRAFT_381289 [Blakeslea trispora]